MLSTATNGQKQKWVFNIYGFCRFPFKQSTNVSKGSRHSVNLLQNALNKLIIMQFTTYGIRGNCPVEILKFHTPHFLVITPPLPETV